MGNGPERTSLFHFIKQEPIMSITEPTHAQLAERWIIQRLREIVTRREPMVAAMRAAIDAAYDGGRAGCDDRRWREPAKRRIGTDIREKSLREAEILLDVRRRYIEGEPGIGTLPDDIEQWLAAMKREQADYIAEMAAECDWLEDVVERHYEAVQAYHDGDTLPTREDLP
jgi:hypothetical protein